MTMRIMGRNVLRLAVAGAVVAGGSAMAVGSASASAAPANPWDEIAQCESGGNWSTSTGNGYSGGLQFSPSTWRAHGGKGSASGASREQQIAVAERVLASQGWGAWPSCSKKVGTGGGKSSGAAKKESSSAASSSSAGGSKSEAKSEAKSKAKSEPRKATKKVAPRKSAPAVAAPQKRASSGPVYVVRPGDTLSEIASANRTSIGSLAGINGVANPDVIAVGQQLRLR